MNVEFLSWYHPTSPDIGIPSHFLVYYEDGQKLFCRRSFASIFFSREICLQNSLHFATAKFNLFLGDFVFFTKFPFFTKGPELLYFSGCLTSFSFQHFFLSVYGLKFLIIFLYVLLYIVKTIFKIESPVVPSYIF